MTQNSNERSRRRSIAGGTTHNIRPTNKQHQRFRKPNDYQSLSLSIGPTTYTSTATTRCSARTKHTTHILHIPMHHFIYWIIFLALVIKFHIEIFGSSKRDTGRRRRGGTVAARWWSSVQQTHFETFHSSAAVFTKIFAFFIVLLMLLRCSCCCSSCSSLCVVLYSRNELLPFILLQALA